MALFGSYCVVGKFSGLFSGDLGFSIAIHPGSRYQLLHYF